MCDSNSDTPTTDTTDECRGIDAQETDGEPGPAYWLDDTEVLKSPLPENLQSTLGAFLGTERVETLAEWVTAVRSETGGGSIDVDELCHAGDATDHWGEVDGDRYHFRCFYDAVILAALEDHPVEIHTVSPDGRVIEAQAVEVTGTEELQMTPTDAVFSFGIGTDALHRQGGSPTLEDGYAAICPYVRAFPNREAYAAWAEDVPAATVALPLSGATAVASALTA